MCARECDLRGRRRMPAAIDHEAPGHARQSGPNEALRLEAGRQGARQRRRSRGMRRRRILRRDPAGGGVEIGIRFAVQHDDGYARQQFGNVAGANGIQRVGGERRFVDGNSRDEEAAAFHRAPHRRIRGRVDQRTPGHRLQQRTQLRGDVAPQRRIRLLVNKPGMETPRRADGIANDGGRFAGGKMPRFRVDYQHGRFRPGRNRTFGGDHGAGEMRAHLERSRQIVGNRQQPLSDHRPSRLMRQCNMITCVAQVARTFAAG